MSINSDLRGILSEFLDSAEYALKKGLLTAAGENFSKVYFISIDALISDIIGVRPENHAKRFDIVKFRLPQHLEMLERVFKIYRKSYSQKLDGDEVEFLRRQAYEIAGKAGFTKKHAE